MQDKLPANDPPETKVPDSEVNVTQPVAPAAKPPVEPVEPSTELPTVEVKVPEQEPLPTEVPNETSTQQWRQVADRISGFIDSPPSYLTEFFDKYKQPLISVSLILLVFISIKLLSGLLDAINEIPLIAPTFELIGLGYAGWFVYRYLLGAKNREELSELVKAVREYIFGKENVK
ncbi:hypothetical protein H6S82_18060 [Planktothrix sp. FACHB-1355]|uniref:Cyanobacterial aminoacyl-tRNA synthetase CAAD domain-containing protein n=1 Tax=Aerosakkonema funiforme FACHB-1375 TaxID=2949571 RepID=A0A926ZI27_9CYAN|nr:MULTISPECIES: CAAD domain-containing protein [Oscillatoriales]MBD2183249.1 hypothetical protein [Aerosakkonema funiforme FACHB-1375]MBD3560738.1 hypothetical protein [Planktothrix sp. FACHB-1355]